MTKYIISSGTSVVSEFIATSKFSGVKITNEADKAVAFENIGDAMAKASEVNNILGSKNFRVMPTEIKN